VARQSAQNVDDVVARVLRLYPDMRPQHASVIGAETLPYVAQPLSPASAQRPIIGVRETALDDAIAASFPASDPPSWTTGTATVAPPSSVR
jgi:hypothetical protein